MKLLNTFLVSMLAMGQCFAAISHDLPPIRVTGTIPQTLPGSGKHIALLKIELSAQAKQALKKHVILARTPYNFSSSAPALPSSIQLGMNKVPVLDQGSHGSCVTFAVTGAIDAMLGMGDYISQLCQLELGTTLENSSYTTSGWDGSMPSTILHRMNDFGIVSKDDQVNQGCAGIYEYPLNDDTPTNAMSLDEYHTLSKQFIGNDSWSSLLDIGQFIGNELDMYKVLNNVKSALNANDRVIVGMALSPYIGLVGMEGTHLESPSATIPNMDDLTLRDTWVMTPQIEMFIKTLGFSFLAGHAMVITGYDDNAVAIDSAGTKHRGLIKLRNSWGENIGDHGDLYMSYDYFVALVMDLNRIRNYY